MGAAPPTVSSKSPVSASLASAGLSTPAIPALPAPITAAATLSSKALIIRVSFPSKGTLKAIRVNNSDTVWAIKRHIIDKASSDKVENLEWSNWGIYLPSKEGKNGKFLDEKREISTYGFDSPDITVEFKEKCRVLPTGVDPQSVLADSKKNQRRFVEEITKNLIDKVKDRSAKFMEPNYWTEDGETPLSIAVMSDDKNLIMAVIECGAHLDYRNKDALKTPLHLAAQHNKLVALQTLISAGAWVNVPDGIGMTPLAHSCSNGHFECAKFLLHNMADPDISDENNRSCLHHACLKNHEALTWILLDYGATMNVQNNVGNTPLHVASTSSAKGCVKWLLTRGADRKIVNKSNHTALQVGMIVNLAEIIDLLRNFPDDFIIPPPPRPTIEALLQNSQQIQQHFGAIVKIPEFGPSISSRTNNKGGKNGLNSSSPSTVDLRLAASTINISSTLVSSSSKLIDMPQTSTILGNSANGTIKAKRKIIPLPPTPRQSLDAGFDAQSIIGIKTDTLSSPASRSLSHSSTASASASTSRTGVDVEDPQASLLSALKMIQSFCDDLEIDDLVVLNDVHELKSVVGSSEEHRKSISLKIATLEEEIYKKAAQKLLESEENHSPTTQRRTRKTLSRLSSEMSRLRKYSNGPFHSQITSELEETNIDEDSLPRDVHEYISDKLTDKSLLDTSLHLLARNKLQISEDSLAQ